MKIAKLTLFLILFLTNHLFAQLYNAKESEPNNLEKEKEIKIKNNVSESFEYIRQNNSTDSILKSHKRYNKNGDLLTNTIFSAKQDTINYAAYEYGGEKLVKSNSFTKNKNVRVFNDIRTFFYDEKGNNNEIQVINKDGKIIYQKIDYNNNNLKEALNTKWLNKTHYSITEGYFYSNNNNLIKKKTYCPNGNLFSEIKYQYDKLGNLIGYYRFQNGKKDIIGYYSYDKDSNLIESGFEYLFGNKPNAYKTKYEYDSNNNIIKKHYFVDNILKYTNIISYKKFE